MPVLIVELAILVNRYKKIKESYIQQFLLLSLIAGFHLSVYVIFDNLFPDSLSLQLDLWFERITEYWQNMSSQMGTKTSGYKLIRQSSAQILMYLPAIYFGGFILAFYSCFIGTRVLKRFSCPETIFWMSLLSFSLGFLGWETTFNFFRIEPFLEVFKSYQILFKNLFVILSCLYFFQGISVSSYLLEKFKIARFWQNLWYILIVLNLPMIFVVIGFVDFLFEFRSFKEMQ